MQKLSTSEFAYFFDNKIPDTDNFRILRMAKYQSSVIIKINTYLTKNVTVK